MKWIKFTVCLVLAGLIWEPGSAQDSAQDAEGWSIEYFRLLAHEDALLEQRLRIVSEEDQEDYWADQRNFEKELKKNNYTAYTAYLQEKGQVYAAHGTVCDSQCAHGRYYWDQATYYGRYGNSALHTEITAHTRDKQ